MQLAVEPQGPSHADTKTAEILNSVRQAFVEKGFDGASMQDLARTAGMSVGNFYRYFSSKAAIIQAMIRRDTFDMQQDFATILTAKQPMAALRAMIRFRILSEDCTKDSGLWAEIEAASRRSPEIASASHEIEEQVIGCLLDVFAAETGLTKTEAGRRFSARASYIMVMFKAASCLYPAATLDQIEVRAMILLNIDQTLDEVVASATRPASYPAGCPTPAAPAQMPTAEPQTASLSSPHSPLAILPKDLPCA